MRRTRAWVAGEHRIGAEAEALHHAGTEALDEAVGLLAEVEDRLDAVGVLRVDPTDRRPRSETFAGGVAGSPPLTFWQRSMRTTSAPMSASSMAVNGPGPMPAISMIFRPARGPDMGSFRGETFGSRSGVGAGDEARDGVDDRRHERQRQVVGHVLDDEELGAGDQLSRALSAREVTSGSRRRAPRAGDRASPGPPPGSPRRGCPLLARHTRRVEAPVVGLLARFRAALVEVHRR